VKYVICANKAKYLLILQLFITCAMNQDKHLYIKRFLNKLLITWSFWQSYY